MGVLSGSNLSPWLIFRAWIVTDQFCWIRFHFNLTGGGGGGGKRRGGGGGGGGGGEKEKMARGVRGLFKGGDYFKYFHNKGRLIDWRLLFKEIRYGMPNTKTIDSNDIQEKIT